MGQTGVKGRQWGSEERGEVWLRGGPEVDRK